MAKYKPYYGFVMHFGYVESAYPSVITLCHTGYGFDTLKEALEDLSWYFYEDFLEDNNLIDDINGFENYLYSLPTTNASAGPSFAPFHWNAERWWPWDSLREMLKHGDKIWENEECMEDCLIFHLDPTRVKDLEERENLLDFKKNGFNRSGNRFKRLLSPGRQKNVSE